MRTNFGKNIVASGLIAAVGANLLAAGPAFAGPGQDRDRNYGREDSRGQNDGRGRNQDRRRTHSEPQNVRPSGKQDGRHAGQQPKRQDNQGPSRQRQSVQWRGLARTEPQHPAARVLRKPDSVHRNGIVQKPVVVEKPRIVHRQAVHTTPVVRTGHGYRDARPYHGYGGGHGSYGPRPARVIVVPERRRYRDVWVVRSYGHRYHGYGHHHRDDDAYKWLAFTAITVALINNLSEYQQRAYEDAQIRATAAPIGETIHWNNAGAYGTVTPTREGTSSFNRYCREFQKTVTIGGQTEQAYGTACMQPDGAWEVISDNSY